MTEHFDMVKPTYPLTFEMDTSRFWSMRDSFSLALKTIAEKKIHTYSESKNAVQFYFQDHPLTLPHPVVTDQDAKSILDTVFAVEDEIVNSMPDAHETYRRVGRHIREYLADRLLDEHLCFLNAQLARGEEGIRELAVLLKVEGRLDGAKSIQRLGKKIWLYREVGSYLHRPELALSSAKVKSRAGARAERGNLWLLDRRQKFDFLEKLSDAGQVSPPFTEEELEFLVSQSSLEMLKNKTELLLKELNLIEPNRLKANYSRLRDHLQRSKQRESDYHLRRELLIKLGASTEQVDYISARATYQTMKNLLKLANGKLAISDLMGGKRTIRKLMRQRGKAQSRAETAIANYLIREEGITRNTAIVYARTRKNHSLEHLKETVDFLKDNYRRIYKTHWGFPIQEGVLRRALEMGLSRQKLSKRSLSNKDFLNDLRRALSLEEVMVVKEQDKLTPDARRMALAPLKEVLDYETDTDTRKQLYFIYEQFCRFGLCIPKDKLKQICLKNSRLFPSPRKVQDALEILNGAYRAIGQHGETLCVLPDYLRLPKKEETQPRRYY